MRNILVGDPMKYDEQAQAMKGFGTLIVSNGSTRGGQDPDKLESLLAALASHTLDPSFERYGNFIDQNPISAATDKPILPAGWTSFWGNFFDVSHVFRIVSNDPEVIAELTKAIRSNQATAKYKEVRREFNLSSFHHRKAVTA